jgi:tetratricopeptide (TPR) repeat protein/DNA-binding CsgD family transcriptional regulator
MALTTQVGEDAASSLHRARRAVRSARYGDALAILDGCEDWPEHVRDTAIVLKADALRLNPVAALEWLTSVSDAATTPAGRFGYELVVGRAFANVRDLDSARAHYAAAERLVGTEPDGALTLAYHRSRLAWMAHEFDPNAPDVAASVAHPDPNMAMAALGTRAWHHGSLGDLRAQIGDFRLALALLDLETEEPLDAGIAAVTCHALARVAFETADAEAMADVRSRYEQIVWTDGIAVERFTVLRTLGWDSFMRGRSGAAQWAFKDALGYAPSTAWAVMARLDRAFVARIAGNEPWAQEELAEADRLSHTVQWQSTFGEERIALLTLAILSAPANAARAQRYASTYSSIGTEAIHPSLAIDSDRRGRAFARYAQGQIDAVLGQVAAAERALRDAYETYVDIGYAFRAAMTASALAEVTGEPSWREKAAFHASAYPSCPLVVSSPAAGAPEPAMPATLSPFQRQVARTLAGGAEIAEVSRALSRSIYTIERQAAAVYEAFGVRSRAEFLVSARGLGLA